MSRSRPVGHRVTVLFAAVFLLVVVLTDLLLLVNYRAAELSRGAQLLVRDAGPPENGLRPLDQARSAIGSAGTPGTPALPW